MTAAERARPAPRKRARGLQRGDAFIETGFIRRCMVEYRSVLESREYKVIVGLPGDGKTWFYRRLLRFHPVRRVDGRVMTDLLPARVPQGGISQNALMYTLGSRLGRLLPGRPAAYYLSLVGLSCKADVKLCVIDNAHELARNPRGWLEGFIDTLRDPSDPDHTPIAVGVLLLANGVSNGRVRSALFSHGRYRTDLGWMQFERRLATIDPVVFVPGLDVDETGEVLAALDEVYRPQFPELDLQAWTEALFAHLLDPRIDWAAVERARIDSIMKCVVAALTHEAADGGWGRGIGPHLERAVGVLKTRPEELDRYAYRGEGE